VVGAGLFGGTIAERIANDLNEEVIVVEKRDNTGGNSFSLIDKIIGIEYHKFIRYFLYLFSH
jgi:UDP-galactopyranose mutase